MDVRYTSALYSIHSAWGELTLSNIVPNKSQVAKVTEEDKNLLEDGHEDDEPPVGVDFVTFMMHAGKMDLSSITTNAVDLMAAGTDTVRLLLN